MVVLFWEFINSLGSKTLPEEVGYLGGVGGVLRHHTAGLTFFDFWSAKTATLLLP